MESDFEKKLKNIKPRKLSQDEREFLWMNIEDGIHQKQGSYLYRATEAMRHFLHLLRVNFKKVLLVPVLITALLAGSLATSLAFADETVPGDFLFPVDIATEQILLTLTFGDTEDTLRLRFAEERLDEVKALLALAYSIEIEGDLGTTTGTSTEDGTENAGSDGTQDTATSTDSGDTSDDTGTDDTSATSTNGETTNGTSTEDNNDTDANNNGVDDAEEEFLNGFDFNINDVEDALLFALAHLEETKAVFASAGNALGVASINSFIDELNNLAENHIDKLDRVAVNIEDKGDDKVKIQVIASSQDLKTRFILDKETDSEGNVEQKIVFRDEDSNSNLKIEDDGKFKFNFSFRKKDNDDSNAGNDDDDDDGDDDDKDDDKDKKKDKKSKDDKKVFVCHKDKKTIHISKNARWAHVLHGDKIGKCGDEDDDDDGDDDGDDDDDDNNDTSAPQISNITADPAITSAVINWSTDENANSTVWYSTESSVTLSSPTLLVTDNALTQDHSLLLSSLSASTTYYYVIVSEDDAGNSTASSEGSFTTASEPAPGDTTAPELSNIHAQATTTEADISWNTNELADSTVYYSVTTPVDPASADKVESGGFVTDHLETLNGLTASTTYYYLVVSSDASGNSATSSEQSFDTTLEPEPEPPADTTEPVISNISTDATTTEATITWDTDEDADSTLFISDATPVDPDTATKVVNGTLVTSHSLTPTGLTPVTTYYYFLVSTDGSGNTATSSEQSFDTTAEPIPADTTAPVISVITPFDIGSTTAAVSWSTDEDANGKLWYSSVDEPIAIADTTAMVSHTDFLQDHTLFLGGLTASTTYQFIVVSADEADNAATSTQDSFITAGE